MCGAISVVLAVCDGTNSLLILALKNVSCEIQETNSKTLFVALITLFFFLQQKKTRKTNRHINVFQCQLKMNGCFYISTDTDKISLTLLEVREYATVSCVLGKSKILGISQYCIFFILM